jgi:hypothetical protein
LGICSRFADRGLSVFVIEGLPLPPNFFGAPGRRASHNARGARRCHQQAPLARQTARTARRSGKRSLGATAIPQAGKAMARNNKFWMRCSVSADAPQLCSSLTKLDEPYVVTVVV